MAVGKLKTILVIEDSRVIRRILIKLIQRVTNNVFKEEFDIDSLELVEAENGCMALEIMNEQSIDLIFLDLTMPEMDGLTFLQEKQKDRGIAQIPVIVCSAVDDEEVIRKSRSLGANGYITKPFSLRSVAQSLREVLPLV